MMWCAEQAAVEQSRVWQGTQPEQQQWAKQDILKTHRVGSWHVGEASKRTNTAGAQVPVCKGYVCGISSSTCVHNAQCYKLTLTRLCCLCLPALMSPSLPPHL